MLIHEVEQLHLVGIHTCRYEATQYLCPPHEGGQIEICEGETATFLPIPHWYILSLGGTPVPVAYCPWCGERLALPGEVGDLSGIDFEDVEDA